MIGVACKAEQVQAVAEFFELFKTPWEFHRPGVPYSVVISTCDEVSQADARLLLVFGADKMSIDSRIGVTLGARAQSGWVNHRDTSIPIYGDTCTFADVSTAQSCITASTGTVGMKIAGPSTTVVRVGYDLFHEIELLLTRGQPVENAGIPTLDLHIAMLRGWILEAGISMIEIVPVPAGHDFAVSLTHDIDFIGIRQHKFDHTMLGFAYRSTLGAVVRFIQGRLSSRRLFDAFCAAASLPLVYFGLRDDFWEPFGWYLKAEAGFPSTYFVIPFKNRAGENVPGNNASRRATKYDVTDLRDRVGALTKYGCEIGVHGLDAWHSAEKGRTERERVSTVTGQATEGVRMHWLLQNADSFRVLDEAGFAYDSSSGYNETVGYRNGTTQVFRPIGSKQLLELPMHIQDGALFFPQRLNLSNTEAEKRCQSLINNAMNFGGVLTLLWHDRSHGPERYWGDFYVRLLELLKSRRAWFGSAGQVVEWFRARRRIRFERFRDVGTDVRVRYEGEPPPARFNIRYHHARQNSTTTDTPEHGEGAFQDFAWSGEPSHDLHSFLQFARAAQDEAHVASTLPINAARGIQ